MSENREVTIHLNSVNLVELVEKTDRLEFYKAIGYLTTWNYTFPELDIYPDGDTDFTAVYRKEDGSVGYVIGAVWHDDHYGFHS